MSYGMNSPGPTLLFLLLASTGCATVPPRDVNGEEDSAFGRFVAHSADDHRRHYDAGSLLDLLAPLAVAGTLANTEGDRWIRDHWQGDVRSHHSDELADVFLQVGDAAQNRWSLPIYSLTMLATDYSGRATQDSMVSSWAERSLRANLLGAPQAWAFTYLLGSHRPEAGESNWNPWSDNDGVSGHSFYGAVPFLTAARMAESRSWRYTLYALSVLPAYARINDNNHYTSQAVMGWSLAWLATGTIAEDPAHDDSVSFLPLLTPDGCYIAVSFGF